MTTRAEDIKEELEELQEELKDLESQYCEDDYEGFLNDCYPEVSICGYNYQQGTALKELDPIAFRCGLSDWEHPRIGELEQEITDLEDELKELEGVEE